jgi:hypothetical protein
MRCSRMDFKLIHSAWTFIVTDGMQLFQRRKLYTSFNSRSKLRTAVATSHLRAGATWSTNTSITEHSSNGLATGTYKSDVPRGTYAALTFQQGI